MSYRDKMMNLAFVDKGWGDGDPELYAYKEGHRDARNACAEIAAEADSKLGRVEDELARLYRLCAEIESKTQDNPLAAPVAQWMREVAARFSRALQETEA